MPVTRTQYFVGNHIRPTGERTTRAIFKRSMRSDGYNWGSSQPIVHDVDSMTITMELDEDGAFAGSKSEPSTGTFDPSTVIGITVNLVLKTPASIRGTNGSEVNRTSSATIGIRSRTT